MSIYYQLDRTLRRVVDYLVPPPDKRLTDIAFRHLAIFGKPESGKTSTGIALAYITHHLMAERQPTLRNYIIRSYRLSDALRRIKRLKPPKASSFFIIIDDAERYALSYARGKAVSDLILAHDLVRHLLKSCGVRVGIVQLLYLTQRFKNLLILCRNADILGFKATTITDLSERDLMYKILGKTYTHQLLKLNYYLYTSWHEEFKGLTLFKLPDGRVRWGLVPYVPYDLFVEEFDGTYIDTIIETQKKEEKRVEEEMLGKKVNEEIERELQILTREKLYSITEVAKMLNIGRVTVWRYIMDGKLKAYRIGSVFKIPHSALMEFMENSRNRVKVSPISSTK